MANSAIMMENMSDSESSDSSESGSSSSSSSSSSESDHSNQSLEAARILRHSMELPKGLIENPNIFNEFFSLDTWRCLPDHMKEQLRPLLPKFDDVCEPKEAHHETNVTLQKLFTNQIKRFDSSPLCTFQQNLDEGNYRTEISRLRGNIKKSQRREQRFQNCERISQLAKSLVVSREQLLRSAQEGKSAKRSHKRKALPQLTASEAAIRSRKRYIDEISKIRQEVGLDSELSEDDRMDEPIKKTKRSMTNNQVTF